ncbi:MAG: hypothetical protein FWD70_03510 [Desulfuromonadales bacterium]|nr:hypothetical protein [Desulfuromonadales bacterium]
MKRITSAVLAAIVAVAFTGVCFAQDAAPANTNAAPTAQTDQAKTIKKERKARKKARRARRKARRAARRAAAQEQVPAPTAAPTPVAPAQ